MPGQEFTEPLNPWIFFLELDGVSKRLGTFFVVVPLRDSILFGVIIEGVPLFWERPIHDITTGRFMVLTSQLELYL